MEETIGQLRERMEAAARDLDFEKAKQIRDRINLMRGGASAEDAAIADSAALQRQKPGAMGLGTSQARMVPPEGWKPPAKPDPMTRGRGRRQR